MIFEKLKQFHYRYLPIVTFFLTFPNIISFVTTNIVVHKDFIIHNYYPIIFFLIFFFALCAFFSAKICAWSLFCVRVKNVYIICLSC